MPEFLKESMRKRLGVFVQYALSTVMAFVLCLSVMTLMTDDAWALRLTMKRVTFEGPRRTELLTIVNNSSEEQAYRLGWRRMRMTEDQSLITVKDDDPAPDLKPVDEMVRFAPRRVVLPPGASQQVRLMLKRPKDLPDGEYRSHFWVQPEAESVKFDPDKKGGEKGPSVQIKMLTGITLPVFVRSGNLTVKASITDVKVGPAPEGEKKITFVLHREGNRSLYGDMEFYCDGNAKPAKEVRGIAVYTEVEKRNMKFEVKPPEGQACNQVSVKYIAPEDDPQFKGAVMAEGASG